VWLAQQARLGYREEREPDARGGAIREVRLGIQQIGGAVPALVVVLVERVLEGRCGRHCAA
jgi:hypothetical protein